MKILLTGSSGFIGKSLKKALNERFDGAEIVSLKRGGPLAAAEYLVDYSDPQTLVECDACRDVDYAFHVAGLTKGVSFEDFYAANVIATENILNALRQKSPELKRFAFISSQAAAGPSTSRQHYRTELEEENPVEYYGESKWMAEQVVKGYSGVLPFTILRPGSVYGPGDADFLNIFKMAKARINVYPGNKKKYFSYIYIDDVVNSVVSACLSSKTAGETYFICNDEPINWQEMHGAIFRSMGKDPVSVSIPFPVVKVLSYAGDAYARFSDSCPLLNVQKIKLSKPDFWIASNQRAKNDFGFEPKTGLEDGVKLAYDHYLRNKQL